MSPNQVVILKEVDGERHLPIFVGKAEGDAITFQLNGAVAPRPLTHDLAVTVLTELGARANHVIISDLRNQHFFATLALKIGETEFMVDARPSDAIALAVRVECPIYVEEHVLDEAGVRPAESASAGNGNLGAFEDFLSSLDLSDLDADK
jgi:bifunctional DNase/RNase